MCSQHEVTMLGGGRTNSKVPDAELLEVLTLSYENALFDFPFSIFAENGEVGVDAGTKTAKSSSDSRLSFHGGKGVRA